MPLGVLGDDTPDIDVATTEDPQAEVHDASAHEEMPQPSSPVLHPQSKPRPASKPATKPNAPADVPVTRPAQVDTRPTTTGSGFPWWLVVLLLVMSEGKKRK